MPQITRDDNRVAIQSNSAYLTRTSIAFTGAANLGAVGTFPVFTVTGDVLLQTIIIASVTLAGATATIAIGTAGNTTGIINTTTATTVAAGDVLLSASTPADVASLPDPHIITGGADIIGTVATANITAGTLAFYGLWRPLSAGASVV